MTTDFERERLTLRRVGDLVLLTQNLPVDLHDGEVVDANVTLSIELDVARALGIRLIEVVDEDGTSGVDETIERLLDPGS